MGATGISNVEATRQAHTKMFAKCDNQTARAAAVNLRVWKKFPNVFCHMANKKFALAAFPDVVAQEKIPKAPKVPDAPPLASVSGPVL